MLSVPKGDVLIHTGVLMIVAEKMKKIKDFNNWLGEQPHEESL